MHITQLTAVLSVLSLSLAACGKPTSEKAMGHDSIDEKTTQTSAEAATIARTPSPEGSRVFFITPANGDTVSNPVQVKFGIEGMNVAKAGDDQPDSGHHHLLIDTDLPDLGLPIPASPNHVHFGDGSTTTEITLEPGTHSLRMLLGDYRHIPHDPAIASKPITVIVE